MMQQMILKGPDFCAVVEDGRLVEYIRQDPKEQGGDILLGKIDRMMPNLNCAFGRGLCHSDAEKPVYRCEQQD